jgi:hypothetical protein
MTLLPRPYWDKDGNILPSIAGRKNRKDIDAFTGGGKVYPDTRGVKVLRRIENGQTLYLQLDETPDTAQKYVDREENLSFQATPNVTSYYNHRDFKGVVVDMPAESGVTK